MTLSACEANMINNAQGIFNREFPDWKSANRFSRKQSGVFLIGISRAGYVVWWKAA